MVEMEWGTNPNPADNWKENEAVFNQMYSHYGFTLKTRLKRWFDDHKRQWQEKQPVGR